MTSTEITPEDEKIFKWIEKLCNIREGDFVWIRFEHSTDNRLYEVEEFQDNHGYMGHGEIMRLRPVGVNVTFSFSVHSPRNSKLVRWFECEEDYKENVLTIQHPDFPNSRYTFQKDRLAEDDYP